MSPSESEEDAKNQRHDYEPLCLFYYPDGKNEKRGETKPTRYIPSTQNLQHNPHRTNKPTSRSQKKNKLVHQRRVVLPSSDETDSHEPGHTVKQPARRRQDLKRRRNPGKPPIHHLASYLLSSVRDSVDGQLPSLKEVLNTIQDAWTTQSNTQDRNVTNEDLEMKIPVDTPPVPQVRRRSVPEEVIRKFVVTKDRTSESETNITMPEATSPSSKETEDSNDRIKCGESDERKINNKDKLKTTAFSRMVEDEVWKQQKSFSVVKKDEPIYSEEEGSSDSDSDAPGLQRFNTIKRAPLRRGSVMEGSEPAAVRISQNDYYRNGKGILQSQGRDKSSQTSVKDGELNGSETTPTARDETESAESSDSLSSPTLCTRPLTSSDNQSSDSEGIKCTCAELTSSKDTSTDPNHSGKSTLSQTVSDKSESTQDSTVSVNSVSSGGSSISAASASSSPDIDPRTSAKETTTSPEHTPRSHLDQHRDGDKGRDDGYQGNRRDRRKGSNNQTAKGNKDVNKYAREHTNLHRKPVPTTHAENRASNIEPKILKWDRSEEKPTHHKQSAITTSEKNKEDKHQNILQKGTLENPKKTEERKIEWANYGEEQIKVMQSQRNRKFIDNGRELKTPIPEIPIMAGGTVSVCTSSGTAYQDSDYLRCLPLTVPRYSALPRTLSMVVNTSSFEQSHNSDSDNQSLADSLEENEPHQIAHYYDTKMEQKPVRGDVAPLPEKQRHVKREPRGKAYFVSLDKEEETPEIVTNVYQVPEPPEKIKAKIYERHVNICKSHRTKERIEESTRENKKSVKVAPIKIKRYKRIKRNAEKGNSGVKRSNHELTKPKKRSEAVEETTKEDTAEGKKGVVDNNKVHSENSETPITHNSQKPDIPADSSDLEIKEDLPIAVATAEVKQPELPPVDLVSFNRHRLSLISSLESTANYLKQQQAPLQLKQWNRPQVHSKRPPNIKFQQKFEVIPEERSSSLTSSAEERNPEKDRRRSLPVKLTPESKQSSLFPEEKGKSFRRYSLGSLSNYIVAKLMGRPLRAIPCVQRGPNNENQQIIVFSPKDPSGKNSAKGRDALLAMNREDFNRLSKGWMNFYLLKENSENESEDVKSTTNDPCTAETDDLSLKEQNTIVCRIPSMERDLTTSGSGTDETYTSPRNVSTLKKNYTLQMKDIGNDYFQLEECLLDDVPEEKGDLTDHNEQVDDVENSNRKENTEKQKLTEDKCKTSLSKMYHASSSTTSEDGTKPVNPHQTPDKNKHNNDDPSSKVTRRTEEGSQETKHKSKCRKNEENKLKLRQLPEDVKLSSSNTVLKTTKPIVMSPKKTAAKSCENSFALPELMKGSQAKGNSTQNHSTVEPLPSIQGSSGSDELDSDSTVYLRAPSPKVPRLPLEGCCERLSDDSFSSSSDSDFETKEHENRPSQEGPLPRRGPVPRGRSRPAYGSKAGSKSEWSVTVAGSVAFPSSTPDVQMRLSFPTRSNNTIVSQSDSGFVEGKHHRSQRSQKTQWTVTVRNPSTGGVKEKHRMSCQLPKLKTTDFRDGKAAKMNYIKKLELEKEEIVDKLTEIWPQVQEVIENALKKGSITDKCQNLQELPLLVNGRAASLDKKPRVLKMSERDVTRSNTQRSDAVN